MKIFIILTLLFLISFYFWNKLNNKWEEFLTTQNVENYMAIAGKLQGAGIKYKTTSGGEEFNLRQSPLNPNIPPISYTIWVLEDEKYKAFKLLNE